MPEDNFTNTLYTNDNLFILNGLNSNLVDLIYLDPPFNTKRLFSAPIGSKAAGSSFKDMWTWQDVNEAYLENLVDTFPAVEDYIKSVGLLHSKAMKAYLTYMVQRIIEMHRILKDTGSLCLHCDPTASHYLKLLLDEIFGKNNFRNEILWCYTGPGSPGMRQFNRKSDTIFWYSKGEKWTFNKEDVRMPYKDEHQTFRKAFDTKGGWSDEDIENLRKKGKVPENWWTDIAIVARSKNENTGYPTQKPLKLLKRIITALSNPGDIVLDPFCGCATACVAAQQLGRKWIGIDVEENAVQILVERLSDDAGLFKNFVATKLVP
ncbi:MAG: site-specific DNA-methyltransferase, partial [Ignavibacteria bacterium]|nr:site-specific DNA-methyltransferase [Ignavibacteria bacterium]